MLRDASEGGSITVMEYQISLVVTLFADGVAHPAGIQWSSQSSGKPDQPAWSHGCLFNIEDECRARRHCHCQYKNGIMR